MRRVAAHSVITPNETYRQAVVVIEDGKVTEVYTFTDELPSTEWLGGTIVVSPDGDGIPRAYHEGKLLS